MSVSLGQKRKIDVGANLRRLMGLAARIRIYKGYI